MKLGILIDRPRAPLSAGEVKLAIEHADVKLSAARIVFVKLATIAERVSLRMAIDPRPLVLRPPLLVQRNCSGANFFVE